MENMETCLAGRLQRSRPNSIFGRLFGEPQKNTVFSIVLYGFKAGRKRGKCGNLLSRQGSPLPGRTRFLAAFLANQ